MNTATEKHIHSRSQKYPQKPTQYIHENQHNIFTATHTKYPQQSTVNHTSYSQQPTQQQHVHGNPHNISKAAKTKYPWLPPQHIYVNAHHDPQNPKNTTKTSNTHYPQRPIKYNHDKQHNIYILIYTQNYCMK